MTNRMQPHLRAVRGGALMMCALLVTGSCTDVGCSSSLFIRLPSTPTEPFRVEVFTPQGAARTFDCPDPQQCGAGAVFYDYLPRSATVRVTIGTRVRDTAIQPRYRTVRPNGRFTGPECQQATADVPFP